MLAGKPNREPCAAIWSIGLEAPAWGKLKWDRDRALVAFTMGPLFWNNAVTMKRTRNNNSTYFIVAFLRRRHSIVWERDWNTQVSGGLLMTWVERVGLDGVGKLECMSALTTVSTDSPLRWLRVNNIFCMSSVIKSWLMIGLRVSPLSWCISDANSLAA